jgi:hypothetical protein
MHLITYSNDHTHAHLSAPSHRRKRICVCLEFTMIEFDRAVGSMQSDISAGKDRDGHV